MHRATLIAPILITFLSGCAYNVATRVAPAINVYSSYDDKVSGEFLYVLDDSLRPTARQVKSSSYACSAHNYPLELGDSIAASVRQTLDAVFENITETKSTPGQSAMTEAMAAGNIMVRLDSFDPRLSCQTGFWSMSCSATTDLSFGIIVRDKNGKQLLGTSAGSSKTVQGDAGGACESAATLLGQSIGDATKDALEKLAERIANSTRLRETASSNGQGSR